MNAEAQTATDTTVQAPQAEKQEETGTDDQNVQHDEKHKKGSKKWWTVGGHDHIHHGTDHWGAPCHVHHGGGGWEYHDTGLEHGGCGHHVGYGHVGGYGHHVGYGHLGGYGGHGFVGHHGKSDIPEECKNPLTAATSKRCGIVHGGYGGLGFGGHGFGGYGYGIGHHGGHGGYHFVDEGHHYGHHGDYHHDHTLQGPWNFGYDHWGDDWNDWDHNYHNFDHLSHLGHHGGYHGHCKNAIPGSKTWKRCTLGPYIAPVNPYFGGYGIGALPVGPFGYQGWGHGAFIPYGGQDSWIIPAGHRWGRLGHHGRWHSLATLDDACLRGHITGKASRRCGFGYGFGLGHVRRIHPLGGWYGWGTWPWAGYGDFVGHGGFGGNICGVGHRGFYYRVPCIGHGYLKGEIPKGEEEEESEAEARQGVVYPWINPHFGPWAAYPWWGDWWGGHGHHGWGGHGEGGGHVIGHGFGGGHGFIGVHGGHHGGWHCRDVIDKKQNKQAKQRFCVPIGYHGGYGWPFWHGYPGTGLGMWGWGWPWIKNKVPKGEKETKTDEKSQSEERKKEKDVNASQRDQIPSSPEESQKKQKKQTIHVGYGYASGDNYRLGYGMGGMGGVSGLSGGCNFPGPGCDNALEGNHNVERSTIPKADESKLHPQVAHDVTATKRHFESGLGLGAGAFGDSGGHSMPYGHPVTHPGFTTIGFPGHALTTTDLKNKIPVYTDKTATVKTKRQIYSNENEMQVPDQPSLASMMATQGAPIMGPQGAPMMESQGYPEQEQEQEQMQEQAPVMPMGGSQYPGMCFILFLQAKPSSILA